MDTRPAFKKREVKPWHLSKPNRCAFPMSRNLWTPGEVLHGVDLSIEEGSSWPCWGTTAAASPPWPSSSTACWCPPRAGSLVGGIDTRVEETQLDVRRQGGLVLQNPDNQLVAGVVEEDVAFGPETWAFPRGDPPPGGGRPQGRGHVITSTGSTPP